MSGVGGVEVGPIDYPDSYEVDRRAEFIRENRVAMRDRSNPSRVTWYCFTCTFRPWRDTGDAERATVTIVSPKGAVKTVPAVERDGRWVTEHRLAEGEAAFVAAGGVADPWGNFNGEATDRVGDEPGLSVPLDPGAPYDPEDPGGEDPGDPDPGPGKPGKPDRPGKPDGPGKGPKPR